MNDFNRFFSREKKYTPFAPIQGVRYSAEFLPGGKAVTISWMAKDSETWQKVLAAVRGLYRYSGGTGFLGGNRTIIPYRGNSRVAGYPSH